MKALLMTVLSLFFLIGLVSPSQADQITTERFVGGTIEGIDSAGLRIIIQTDLGKSESLPVANAEVMKGVSKGDQVSVELDEQGRVMKIVKTSPDQVVPEPKS